MSYDVLVKKFNTYIEEEVTISVNNLEINCFVTDWGTKHVEVNKKYKANILISIFDDIDIKESNKSKNLVQIEESFAYIIFGKFCYDNYSIDCGIVIEFDRDEIDLSDYAYLDKLNVALKVDRISLEFIS